MHVNLCTLVLQLSNYFAQLEAAVELQPVCTVGVAASGAGTSMLQTSHEDTAEPVP